MGYTDFKASLQNANSNVQKNEGYRQFKYNEIKSIYDSGQSILKKQEELKTEEARIDAELEKYNNFVNGKNASKNISKNISDISNIELKTIDLSKPKYNFNINLSSEYSEKLKTNPEDFSVTEKWPVSCKQELLNMYESGDLNGALEYSENINKSLYEIEMQELKETSKGEYFLKRTGQFLENSGEWLTTNLAAAGTATADGLASTVDFILGWINNGDNAFSETNEYWSDLNSKWQKKSAEVSARFGDYNNISGTVLQTVIEFIPDLLLLLATGGGSAASTATKALGTAGTVTTAGIITSAATNMAQNPIFWSSLIRELGTDYENAQSLTDDDSLARLYALTTATLNSGIEAGFGIETEIPNIIDGKSNLANVIKSIGGETLEEVAQNTVSRTHEKILLNSNKEMFSTENEDAVFNPSVMFKEALIAFLSSAAIVGSTTSISNAINSKTNTEIKQLGKDVKAANNPSNGVAIDINELIKYSEKSADAQIRNIALNSNVENISDYNAGLLYKYVCADIQTVMNTAQNTEQLNNSFNYYLSQTNQETVRNIALAAFSAKSAELSLNENSATNIGGEIFSNTNSENSEISDGLALENSNYDKAAFTDKELFYEFLKGIYNNDYESISGETDIFKLKATSEEARAYIKEIGKKLDISIEFTDTSKLLADSTYVRQNLKFSPEGIIETDTGKIYIDYNAETPVVSILKHELTHFCEKSSVYGEFVNSVFKSEAYNEWLCEKTGYTFGDTQEMQEVLISQKMQDYSEVQGFDEQSALCEIVADFVSEKLYNDVDSVNNLINGMTVTQRKTFIQYILDFIAYLKNKLSGIMPINNELSKLENNFKELLADAKNEYGNDITENGKYKYFLLKETDSQLINKAEKFEEALKKQGKSEEEIVEAVWKNFKLVRGFSGEWIYEINATDMQVFPNGDAITPEKKREGMVSDFVKFDPIFEKYPQLANTRIKISDISEGVANVSFSKNGDHQITVRSDMAISEIKFKKELLHEMQHFIQMIEDRNHGSSINYWKSIMYKEGFEGLPQKNGVDLKLKEEFETEFQDLYSRLPTKEKNKIKRLIKALDENDDAKALGFFDKEGYGSLFFEPAYKALELHYMEKHGVTLYSPYNAYWYTAGEIEARMVAERNINSEENAFIKLFRMKMQDKNFSIGKSDYRETIKNGFIPEYNKFAKRVLL